MERAGRDFMNRIDTDELLSRLGLETKPSFGQTVVSVLGPFAVGVLVGAAAALLLAPKSGRELREGLRQKVSQADSTGRPEDLTGAGGSKPERKPG
jgi:YtxH-like protein